jgi:hypothetical protein
VPDFGFNGDAYTAPSIYQNDSELINWYCEVDQRKAPASATSPAERGRVTLYPTPGLTAVLQLIAGEVRGLYVFPGGQILIAVSGSTVYSISSAFVPTVVGTLASSSSPVSISDNAVSVYIVDGANRYAYTPSTGVFITLPSTDGAFTGADRVDNIDNFLIYNRPGTQQWGSTAALSINSAALSFASKFGSSDNLVTLICDHREVWLLGERTSEVWVDVGSFPFPFQIIPGTAIQHGCGAKNSITRFGNTFAFLAKDSRGQTIFAQAEGYSFKRISTHAVESDLLNQTVSDCIGYTYQVEGHEFAVFIFPTADKTWVFDLTTQMWHKWLSVDSLNVFHRHRSNCFALFQNQLIVGDYQNGLLYSIDKTKFTDNGATIRRVRRCPHLVADFKQFYFSQLQLQFQPGVGLDGIQQGTDPQAMLRWSNDGGSTWSNEHWKSIGQIGKYRNRVIWRRLGQCRDRIFEVVVTDPINAVIVSANLEAEPGTN